MLLPSPDDFVRLQGTPEAWLPAMNAIRARHGGGPPAPTGLGSNVLFTLGEDRFVKLFPPRYQFAQQAECAALTAVHGRLGVASPEVLAEGEIEGWPYLVLSRVPGRTVRSAWPALDPGARARLMEAAGTVLRALHGIAVPGLDGDWAGFVAKQRALAYTRQAGWGVAPALLSGLDRALERAADDDAIVPLHADLTGENMLVDDAGRLSAVLDFGDARSGARDYDLVTPGMLVAAGERLPHGPSLFRILRDATGSSADPGRVLAFAALHPFNDLTRYRGRTVEEMGEIYFG